MPKDRGARDIGPELRTKIGNNVRRIRSERGESQEEFGEFLGFTQATVSHIETGYSVGLGTLLILREKLQRSLDELIGLDPLQQDRADLRALIREEISSMGQPAGARSEVRRK